MGAATAGGTRPIATRPRPRNRRTRTLSHPSSEHIDAHGYRCPSAPQPAGATAHPLNGAWPPQRATARRPLVGACRPVAWPRNRRCGRPSGAPRGILAGSPPLVFRQKARLARGERKGPGAEPALARHRPAWEWGSQPCPPPEPNRSRIGSVGAGLPFSCGAVGARSAARGGSRGCGRRLRLLRCRRAAAPPPCRQLPERPQVARRGPGLRRLLLVTLGAKTRLTRAAAAWVELCAGLASRAAQ